MPRYTKLPATPPTMGATTGTHHQPPPAVHTPLPHPAMYVNSLGAKSLAGLMASAVATQPQNTNNTSQNAGSVSVSMSMEEAIRCVQPLPFEAMHHDAPPTTRVHPVLYPKQMPMPTTHTPASGGMAASATALLRVSVMANKKLTRNAVLTT